MRLQEQGRGNTRYEDAANQASRRQAQDGACAPKTAIIDVGGGERGIYGAGVCDWLLENGVSFDVCIGVSAGAANLATYLAGQAGRTYRFYMEYSFRKEYMSLGNYLRKGSYLDLDYVYGTLSNSDGEDPLGYEGIVASGKDLRIVATDADTGLPHYFSNDDMSQNDYGAIAASCSLPLACPARRLGKGRYFDGGLSDPIPLERAFQEGCNSAVVVLTRPRDFYRDSNNDRKLARLLKRRYPRMAEALSRRAEIYNQQLDYAKHCEAEGRALIVAPETINGMSTLTKDKEKLQALYERGRQDAQAIPAFLQSVCVH